MSTRILLHNTIWSSISHILSRGTLMLSGILLAKYLTPEKFAVYSYFQMTTTMLAAYSAMGLGVAASKYFAELANDFNNQQNINTVSNLFTIASIFSILITVAVLLTPNELLTAGLGIPNFIIAIAVLSLSLNIIPGGAILGLEKYKEAALFYFLNCLIFLIGVLLSVLYNEVIYSITAFIFASIIQLLGNLFIINKSVSTLEIKRVFRLDIKTIHRIYQFSGPLIFVSMITASSGWIIGRGLIDQYDEHIFAVYSIGLQWFSLALFLPGMISRVILPRLIREKLPNKKTLRVACAMSFTFSFIIFSGGSIFSKYIISFYGENYSEYNFIIIGFLLVALLYAPANTLGNAIVSKVSSLHWFFITLVWFVSLMIIFYLRVSKDGILSVIYAQAFATTLLLILSFIVCRKKGLI